MKKESELLTKNENYKFLGILEWNGIKDERKD